MLSEAMWERLSAAVAAPEAPHGTALPRPPARPRCRIARTEQPWGRPSASIICGGCRWGCRRDPAVKICLVPAAILQGPSPWVLLTEPRGNTGMWDDVLLFVAVGFAA